MLHNRGNQLRGNHRFRNPDGSLRLRWYVPWSSAFTAHGRIVTMLRDAGQDVRDSRDALEAWAEVVTDADQKDWLSDAHTLATHDSVMSAIDLADVVLARFPAEAASTFILGYAAGSGKQTILLCDDLATLGTHPAWLRVDIILASERDLSAAIAAVTNGDT